MLRCADLLPLWWKPKVTHVAFLTQHTECYAEWLKHSFVFNNATGMCHLRIYFPYFWCLLDCASLWWLKNKKPTRCHLLHLLYFLDTQHVSGINMSILRSLRLCCWTTTLAVLYCCVLESGCGSARVVSGLPAEAQLQPAARVLTPTAQLIVRHYTDYAIPAACVNGSLIFFYHAQKR